jgi:hypothetical protein
MRKLIIALALAALIAVGADPAAAQRSSWAVSQPVCVSCAP